MVPMAVLLYWFRRAHRFWYGGFEFVIAFGAMYFLLLGMITAVKAASISLGTITARILAMFAVAYFMVRALDNIGEGLQLWSVVEKRWNLWFPKAQR